jgi:hypothetical protein
MLGGAYTRVNVGAAHGRLCPRVYKEVHLDRLCPVRHASKLAIVRVLEKRVLLFGPISCASALPLRNDSFQIPCTDFVK